MEKINTIIECPGCGSNNDFKDIKNEILRQIKEFLEKEE